MDPILMRHNKDDIMMTAQFLYGFSSNNNYRDHLRKMIEYVEDVTNLMLQYKQVAEDSSTTLEKLVMQIKNLPQDHKRGNKND